MKECANQKVQSRVWKVSSLKRAQSRGDSWQEALEGPVRPGMQLSSLCEGGSDQPIRNQGSITTTHKAGLTASAVAVSMGGASRGGFSTHSENEWRASGTGTVVETSSRSPTVEVDRQAERKADPH